MDHGNDRSRFGLENHGLRGLKDVYWNLGEAALTERALLRGEGILAEGGALVARTGKYTGRSPKDKFVVKEPTTEGDIWWGSINQPVEEAKFDALYNRV